MLLCRTVLTTEEKQNCDETQEAQTSIRENHPLPVHSVSPCHAESEGLAVLNGRTKHVIVGVQTVVHVNLCATIHVERCVGSNAFVACIGDDGKLASKIQLPVETSGLQVEPAIHEGASNLDADVLNLCLASASEVVELGRRCRIAAVIRVPEVIGRKNVRSVPGKHLRVHTKIFEGCIERPHILAVIQPPDPQVATNSEPRIDSPRSIDDELGMRVQCLEVQAQEWVVQVEIAGTEGVVVEVVLVGDLLCEAHSQRGPAV